MKEKPALVVVLRRQTRAGLTEAMPVHLAGVPVRDEAVSALARLVDDLALATKLEDAYRRGVKILALEISERETIIAALEDPPPGLEELRAVLLQEHGWRRAEGL